MAIRGNLRTLNLRNLVQVNCQGGYTSRIHVWTDRGEGEIYIERGQVVHAWFGRTKGKEALLYILSLPEGEFLQEMNVPAPERTIDQDWMMLFLETLQKQEETSTTRLSASLGVEEEPLEVEVEEFAEEPIPAGEELRQRVRGKLLVKRHGRLTGEEIDVEGDVIIGKFSKETGPVDIDLSFLPEAPYVSRRHARIFLREDGKFVIEDLGSTNGTYINRGPRIVAPTVLEDGDEITLGNAHFVFRYVIEEGL